MITKELVFQIIIVLALSTVIKAGGHFMRLALMMFMGLMGMFLMHKLAQDYQHYSKPAHAAGKLLGLWKRSIPDNELADFKTDGLNSQLPFLDDNNVITFSQVLDYDQSQCARRLVCEIGATPTHLLNSNEQTIIKILRFKQHDESHTTFRNAAALGKMTKNQDICKLYFKKCKLSNDQMYRIMKVF